MESAAGVLLSVCAWKKAEDEMAKGKSEGERPEE